MGRVERELQRYGQILGLVFGAWGEASRDVHLLVDVMANSRLRSQQLTQHSRVGVREEKSVVVGQIRRCVSVAVMRANSACLLDRLHQVGQGVAGGNGRRAAAQWEEEGMRAERVSEWSARTGGRSLSRGLFFK